jgi:hypothetical protein
MFPYPVIPVSLYPPPLFVVSSCSRLNVSYLNVSWLSRLVLSCLVWKRAFLSERAVLSERAFTFRALSCLHLWL